MKKILSIRSVAFAIVSFVIIFYSCSKGGSGGGTPPDPCAGVAITVTAVTTNPATAGATNGTIVATATGSTGFTYSINGAAFQSSGTFNNLGAGAYTIVAKNASGCSGSASFTLTAPNPCAGITINVTGTPTNPTSTVTTNGSIVAAATGSTGFTYNINGGAFQASATFSNLGTGAYTIVAKDLNGCTGSANFTLTAPNPCASITINVTGTVTNPTSSVATNGNIVAAATGSTGFTFNINGGAFQPTGAFNNLAAGTYAIIAKDLNGCTGTANFTLAAPNPCAAVTITLNNAVVGNSPCEATNTGQITVTPTGGTAAYLFSLNSGAFQSSNIFANLAAATYTISAKDANGCTGTNTATINNLAAGPLFNAVKTVLQNNCVSCHNSGQAEGGMNWTVDCNIVQFKDRIKARAVDAAPSSMPPTGLLPASERQKITDWINAGGKFSN